MARHKLSELRKFEQWLLDRGRSEGTAVIYSRNVRLCLAHAGGPTSRITSRSMSPATRRLNLASMRAWCKYSGDDELLERVSDLKMPRLERVIEKKALIANEWGDMLEALDEYDANSNIVESMRMICIRGFRIGDVLRLKRSEIRDGLESGVLNYLAKAQRRIHWSIKPFRDSLEHFASQSGWTHIWDLVSPSAVRDRPKAARVRLERCFRELAEQAGIDPETVYPHRLRRTYAKHYLAETGGDPVKLQKHMGWASIQTAMSYVDEEEREVLDKDADRMLERLLR